MFRHLTSERGHIGVGVASLLTIAGTVLLVWGISANTDGLAIAGAIALGIGVLISANAPHRWLRSVYRRLDRVDPDDHEAMPEKRFRVQL